MKSKRGNAYKRTYRNVAKHLASFEESRGLKIVSNSFSSDAAEDFIDFMREKGLMKSTIASYYSKVCHMFRKMGKRGYDVDFSFEDVTAECEAPASVFLSSEEIDRIYRMKIKHPERDLVRDVFVANCLVGMRFGDFSELSNDNISGNIIRRKTKKVNEDVEVPIHRIVAEIIRKYGGDFPHYKKSHQNYNSIVKRICQQANITDKVLWERTRGRKVVRKTVPRYELVSSHTARRSFATNAYLAGIPVARIMLVTGHRTEQAFFRYICISKKENAVFLSSHEFFK